METPDYSKTVKLPKTDFPMRGNLPVREPELIKRWDENKIYHKMVEKNQGRKKFTMPDGPPYANGNIHIGHVLNKTLKDIVIKYKNMSGQQAAFIPGWDTHGLPIEHGITKKLGEKRKEMSDAQIRGLCRKEAQKWVDAQKKQFHRLGILSEWERPYITMAAHYEAEEVRVLARTIENGVVYQGVKPVHWNWALQTALADAEVEHQDHTSPSIYVKFDVKNPADSDLPEGTGIVIWTTTPWTLPANLAISVHAEFEYALFESEKGHLIIASELQESFENETELTLTKVRTFTGQSMAKWVARHPFIDRDSVLLIGDHVTLEAGTGAVHTAPGHGVDDFNIGKKYGLDAYCPVDEAGKYTKDVPEYQGENIFKVNPKIVERLKESGHLLGLKHITHSYPHCWRSKIPLIFRTTPQWFIAMEDEKFPVRQKALKAMEDIEFFPRWGQKRFHSMIQNRPDWCISRQRIWGVPIPVFYCKATGKALLEPKYLYKLADIMAKGTGIEAWWDTPTEELLEDFEVQGEFGSKGFKKGTDILDVWFDSGICHAAVQDTEPNLENPANIYLEGSDQHRGWFNTSLISSIASTGKSPFKALVTHGFVLDSKGKKMSKSAGNVVDPDKVIKKSGAEILRLWSAYEDYSQDLTIGNEIFDRVTETYRRIRNTMRFLLGNLGDFQLADHRVDYDQLTDLDKWALHELNELVIQCKKAYDEYDFYKVYHALNIYFTVNLSSQYLDILKDRLYTWNENSRERRGSQYVLHEILSTTVRLMAPILSFLAEEVYDHFSEKNQESIFLEDFPSSNDQWQNPELGAKFAQILELRSTVAKALEELRAEKIIRSSLEAKVTVTVPAEDYAKLNVFTDQMREILIISEFKLAQGEKGKIDATKADGEKCPRCWHFDTVLDSSSEYPGVCKKCVGALSV